MKKIVIAIDSFKGCLSSKALADAVQQGIKSVFPSALVCKLSIADGGEGTVDALVEALQGERITCQVSGPLRNPVAATYGWVERQKLAIIELAAASGLPLIPYEQGNVMRTTTYGTGQLVADALRRGCRKVLLAIGGSATNDAGIGLFQALGYRFLDKEGDEVADGGAHLGEIVRVDEAQVMPEVADCEFEVLVDVTNPFYGERGAAQVFAPQKGATPQQVLALDRAMRKWADYMLGRYGIDVQQLEGSGAAGGVGGGCAVFLRARLESGIASIKRVLHFDELIEGADLIITGEGKVDSQTAKGKVVSGVLESAKRRHIPVIALTGNYAEPDPQLDAEELLTVFSIHPAPIALEDALNPDYAARQIERVVRNLMKLIQIMC